MDSELPWGQGWLHLTAFTPAPGEPDAVVVGDSGTRASGDPGRPTATGTSSDSGRVAVTLECELRRGRRPPKDLRLLARRGEQVTAHLPVGSALERISGSPRIRRSQCLRWSVNFELPAATAADRRAKFELACEQRPPLPLPALGYSGERTVLERRGPRTSAVLACIGALLAGIAPGLALASGGSSGSPSGVSAAAASPTTAAPSTVTVPAPASTTAAPPGDTQPTTTGTTPIGSFPPPTTTTTTPTTTTTQTTTTPTTTTTQTSTTTQTTTTTTTSTTPTTTAQTTTSTTTPTTTPKKRSSTAKKHHTSGRKASAHHHRTASRKPADKAPPARQQAGGGGTPAPASPEQAQITPEAPTGDSSTWTLPATSEPFSAAQLSHYAALVGGLAQPPKYLVKIYQAAARHYRLPWQVLAAINYVETRYGQDLAVSSAGAIGWMQFMPSTWAEYGASVNLQGKPAPGMPNPWQPTDAIFAAARYLTAAGAQRNLPRAIYAYNHATWYVQEVLSIAEQITRHGLKAGAKARQKIAAMTTMARLLNGLPYVWGGGHGSFAYVATGYDCSGFVSAVLHAAGYLQAPQTTQTLPAQPQIKPGPGKWVTILDRTDAGIGDDHVIIDIDGQWWESGGEGVEYYRVHRMHDPTTAYLQSFNLVLHPRGL